MIITKGRITTAYKITGTESFRLAASKLLGFYGTNLQNPSESLMRCIIPNDGNVFIQPDQGGAEALIVAMETRPAKFRKLFDLNIKCHSYMALQIFTEKFRGTYPATRYKNIDPEEFAKYQECKELLKVIKNSPNEYGMGKQVIHAKNYNMGPRTFQINVLEKTEGAIVLTFKQAKEFLATHETIFPEIVEWQAKVKGEVAATRVLRNLFGYPRRFERLWNEELERQAYAFIPQSTVGTITNIAYTELYHRIKKEKLPWTLLGNKHDSFLLEVPDTKEHIEMGCAYSKEHLGRRLTSTRGEEYFMRVGISIGHNWGHWHEIHNPQGIKEI